MLVTTGRQVEMRISFGTYQPTVETQDLQNADGRKVDSHELIIMNDLAFIKLSGVTVRDDLRNGFVEICFRLLRIEGTWSAGSYFLGCGRHRHALRCDSWEENRIRRNVVDYNGGEV